MRGSRDGKQSPYAPLLASSAAIAVKLHRIGGSVVIFIFQDLDYAAGGILPCFGRDLLARQFRLPVKAWMICSLTGAVPSEIVSKVRKLLTSSNE